MQTLLSLEYCLYEAALICEGSILDTALKYSRKCEALGEVREHKQFPY